MKARLPKKKFSKRKNKPNNLKKIEKNPTKTNSKKNTAEE